MQKSSALVVILLVSLLWTSAASAQVATGTISGTVTDNTGAVLPGVSVVVQNQDTGISRTVLTNETGHYSAPTLGVGQYRLTVSLDGFQTLLSIGGSLDIFNNVALTDLSPLSMTPEDALLGDLYVYKNDVLAMPQAYALANHWGKPTTIDFIFDNGP